MNNSQLNNQNLQALRLDIDAALKAVAAKHGVVLKTGRCRFSPSAATMELSIATISDTGEVVDREMAALKANVQFLGLTESHLSQTFKISGQTFKLTGYNSRRSAKPFRLLCVESGRTYVARDADVRVAFDLPRRLSGWTPRS